MGESTVELRIERYKHYILLDSLIKEVKILKCLGK